MPPPTGYVNPLSTDAVSGWAALPDTPDVPAWLELVVDGEVVAEIVCREPHAKALAAGHAGARRFFYRPGAHLRPGRNAVLLRFAGTGLSVPNGAGEIVLDPAVAAVVPARGAARRLAVVDIHFPWRVCGFTYWENLEILRQRPDTVFFAVKPSPEPFPVPVYPFHEFLRLAVRGEFTDAYCVFLNLAASLGGCAVLPSGEKVPGADPSLDISRLMVATGLRLHATFYAGGGLDPTTPAGMIQDVGQRCATVFTNLTEVERVLPGAQPCLLPVNVEFYAGAPRPLAAPFQIAFCHANAARKNFSYLARAFNQLDDGFHLQLVGDWDGELHRLTNPRYTFHGKLDPEALRDVYRRSHAFVVCSTADPYALDGWPTTAGADALASECLLLAGNYRKDYRTLKPSEDYLEVDLDDPESLVRQVRWARDHWPEASAIAARGSAKARRLHDLRPMVERKLRFMLG